MKNITLSTQGLSGALSTETFISPIHNATTYIVEDINAEIIYQVPQGAFSGMNWLSADILVEGLHSLIFYILLAQANGKKFYLGFSTLTECQARIRLDLSVLDQNKWILQRQGAFLKPLCMGDALDPDKIVEMKIIIARMANPPVRFHLAPFVLSTREPELLKTPVATKGPLLDAMGQSALHDWPEKTRNEDELVQRLCKQLEDSSSKSWPKEFSRWGGFATMNFEGTGYFRTHHDNNRWWLVDPDGHPFWSVGPDCVNASIDSRITDLESALQWLPEADGPFMECISHRKINGKEATNMDFLAANFIRAFGPENWKANWTKIMYGELRGLGFNTVANWSDWKIAKEAGFPYVVPLENIKNPRAKLIFRDLPDIFDPAFQDDATEFAEQLKKFSGDPALIGYFLMNEPSWGFSALLPALGMLHNAPPCATRKAFADFLHSRYSDDQSFKTAWATDFGIDEITKCFWNGTVTPLALIDLETFSSIMVARFFGTLSQSCKAVDPNHLNLGMRYYTVPPAWVMTGLKELFDVFSINCYKENVPPQDVQAIADGLGMPVMVGEWSFGALDVGLPTSGIKRVANQADRAKAYRCYVESAASLPGCIGVHWFTLYDESAIGRFDGENWNIGFFDVCNRPYTLLYEAARISHEHLYQVASGAKAPYSGSPEFLPPLFN